MQSMIDSCFMCTKDYNCVPVDDKIISQVEYLLPEITIFKLGVPLRICAVCDGTLYSFKNFKQFSLETSRRLETRIKGAQPLSLPLHTDVTQIFSDNETSDSDPGEISLHEENLRETTLNTKFHSDDNFDSYSFKNTHEDDINIKTNLYTEEKLSHVDKDDEIVIDSSESENEIEETTQKEEEEMENSFDDSDSYDKTKTNTGETMKQTKKHTCNICYKPFTQKWILTRHLKTHQSLFPCQYCWMVFESKSEIDNHTKTTHSTESVNVQQKNNETTHSEDNEFTNLIKEKVEAVHQCPICKKVCPRKHNLKQHMKIHSEKNYQCNLCKRVFRHKDLLVFHTKRMHTDTKKYPCSQCEKSFISTAELYIHLKRHGVLPEFPCHLCGRKFMYYSHFQKHLKTHVESFPCNICNKVFSKKFARDRHYKIHCRDIVVKCEKL